MSIDDDTLKEGMKRQLADWKARAAKDSAFAHDYRSAIARLEKETGEQPPKGGIMPEEEKPAWNFQSSKQAADLEPFMETESSPSTQGVCPLRLPREPIEGISSVGVDTVFPRDLNRFTLDTLRDVKKYRGPSALISSLEHYTPLFEKAKVFDAKTIEDFRTMIRMLKAAPTPKAKEELFETKITDYLKNISMTRG